MKFIKKNGKIVSFEPLKIKTSVENAGSDLGIQLNSKESRINSFRCGINFSIII